jgi:hypothetical protein
MRSQLEALRILRCLWGAGRLSASAHLRHITRGARACDLERDTWAERRTVVDCLPSEMVY